MAFPKCIEAVRNVEEPEGRKLAEQWLVLDQMRNESGQLFEARIGVGKCDHRGSTRNGRTEKQREPVHEIPKRWLALRPTRIQLHRKALFWDVEFLSEMGDLFGFAFEVLIPLVRKNKIEAQKPGLDGLQPMPAAIAKILAADLRVQLSGIEMIDAPIPPIFPHAWHGPG